MLISRNTREFLPTQEKWLCLNTPVWYGAGKSVLGLSEVVLLHFACSFLAKFQGSKKSCFIGIKSQLQVLGSSIDRAFVHFLANFHVFLNP